MSYHSADYDHDWKIGVAELARVAYLASTSNGIVVTGCYKVDITSIDGFAPDTNRDIDEQVTLTHYHSADINRDGRIDDNDVARVTELYDYEYLDVGLSANVRSGQYHDNNPFSIDGFGVGPVQLSDYSFDTKHKPLISINVIPDSTYRLRAKLIDGSTNGFMAATSLNNSGAALDTLPPEGVYNVELYWIQYDSNGNAIYIGTTCKVVVEVSPEKVDCRKSNKDCICGDEEPVIENEDKGQCFPYREKRSCNAPTPPIAECSDTKAYVVFTPDQTPPFYVVSRLFDQLCDPITDQDGKDILTIIK